jgi:hypothetical protein
MSPTDADIGTNRAAPMPLRAANARNAATISSKRARS